jgi:malate synthase
MKEFVGAGRQAQPVREAASGRGSEGGRPAELPAGTPITEAGLRYNINVGIHYLGAWLAGNGCVPIHNLMEDAATAEISRSQVWQWIRSAKGKLEDGRKVTAEMVRAMIPEELAKVKQVAGDGPTYDRAARSSKRCRPPRLRRVPDAAAVRRNLIQIRFSQ